MADTTYTYCDECGEPFDKPCDDPDAPWFNGSSDVCEECKEN